MNDGPATPYRGQPGKRTLQYVVADDLRSAARALLDFGYRLALVAAHDDTNACRIVYLFTAADDHRVELVLHTDRTSPTVPSLAALSFAAGRFEREIHDLFGVVPLQHPLPRRLVRHDHWPRGWYPMLADAGPPPPFGSADEPFPFVTVEGDGVYEVPVGPVHAGLIEPGHFRFSVVGETIVKLKARLWFVHKGIERLAQGRTPDDALPLAERVSGDTSVGHALAFCLAVEEALGVPVPRSAAAQRAVLLELERLYNHVADIGALCNDVGYGIVHAHAMRIRERLLRLNAAVTGHRLLRGAVRPGGAHLLTLPPIAELREIAADVAEIVDIALNNSIVRERFTATSVLSAAQAREIGALGYAARAAGVDIDARRDHPFLDTTASVEPVVPGNGDVLARFLVRAGEVRTSVDLLALLLAEATGDGRAGSRVDGPALGHGVGLVEGWRGTIAHRVELDARGVVTRWKVVDPSFLNWPALPVALTDTILPDFPLTNKSFNLSYAGNDP
jgi:Ni,Fe-hydrogenase III large subunit/Ni,Fe-hydrogenase III component G